MKKLLALSLVLFGAVLFTSATASAQVYVGVGHRGVVVGVPAYAPAYAPAYDYCGVDSYGNPIVCQPVVPDCGYYCGNGYYPGYYGYYGYYGRDNRGYGYRGGYSYGAPRGNYNYGGQRGGYVGGGRGGNVGGGRGGRR
jgi:hypothetical protein